MKALKILFSVLILSGFNLAFGLETPININLDKATDNSLELSWDEVEGAGAYSISYGTKTASGSTYENDQAEIISTSSGILNNLLENTKYYIAIKAYDDNNNESEYSKEVIYSTLEKVKDLKIDSINVVDTRNFEIKFNINLNKDSVVNLNIVNSSDDLENIEIEKYTIEKNVLKVFLVKDLRLNSQYSFTIITLEGSNGETIKKGVNGVGDFTIDKNIKVYKKDIKLDLNSVGTGTVENTGTGTVENTGTKVLGGKDVITDKNNIKKVVSQKEKLPTTGPTETFLFLIFALIAGGLFMNLRRKTSL